MILDDSSILNELKFFLLLLELAKCNHDYHAGNILKLFSSTSSKKLGTAKNRFFGGEGGTVCIFKNADA